MTHIDDVKQLYQDYPYPSPVAGEMLITDVSNAIQYIAPETRYSGRNILDAGCGTGHRLIALAKALPYAKFTGIDITARSMETARALADRHGVTNVTFAVHDIATPVDGSYDVVVCTGVITCVQDPELSIRNLLTSVADDGFLLLWVYHQYGEFARLLDRRLAQFVAERLDGAPSRDRLETLRRLQISLPIDQYGAVPPRQRLEANQASIDADAYLHPIVNVFTFGDMVDLLRRHGAEWIAVNGVNWRGSSKLIDLGNTMEDPYFAVTAGDVLNDREYQSAFEALSVSEKLTILELAIKPTGFTILAGRNRSYLTLDKRIRENVI